MNQVEKPIVFFDGECNFCDQTINFILEHDRKDIFLFSPLQSPLAKRVLPSELTDLNHMDTIIVLTGKSLFLRSQAAIEILKALDGLWWLVAFLMSLVPTPIRDFFYQEFAKRRYRWFGKRDSCRLPSAKDKLKMLWD